MIYAYLIPAVYDAALGVFSFALPLFLVDSGVPPLLIGTLLAMPAVVQIFARVPMGLLAGRIGNTPAMLLGCGLMAASAGLIGLSPAAALAVYVGAAQVFSGLGRASFWPANQAYLFETAGDRAASVIGVYNFLVTLGGMAGPLVAAAIIVSLGYRQAFGLLAGLCVVSAVLLTIAAKQGRRRTISLAAAVAGGTGHDLASLASEGGNPAQLGPLAALGRVARSPEVWLAGLVCVASVVPFTVTTSFYPILLRSKGISAASISLLVTVRSGAVALFSLLTGPYVRPGHRAALIFFGAGLGAAGLLLIAPLAGTSLGVLPMILFGFCGGALHNVQMALAGEAVAARDRALAMALVGSVGNIAMAVTPLWHGWMTGRGLLEEAFPLTGVLLALVGAAAWRWCLARQKSRGKVGTA